MTAGYYIQVVLAFVFVLALIGGAGFLAKRYGAGAFGALRSGGRPQRRLAVSEVLALDAKRRLVLVRRDGAEHLLLLGGTRDLVVETGIVPPPAFRDALAEAGAATPDTAP